jgi:hypothetical protein
MKSHFWGLAILLLVGCDQQGKGAIAGIHYRIDLPGSYSLRQWSDREQVWIPSGDERPIVSLRLGSRGHIVGQAAAACNTSNRAVGKSEGGFVFVRAGSSVELQAMKSPAGVAVHASACIPPGEQSLGCMANYSDGAMSPAREAAATAICKSLALR